MSKMTNLAYRAAATEEQSVLPPPTPPPEPPPPPPPPVSGDQLSGYDHIASNGGLPVFKPGYGSTAYNSYKPDVSLYGTAYTVNSGTWNRDGGRDYTLGDGVGQRARVNFTNFKTHKAGRLDASDRSYMANNAGRGWNGYAAQENTLILTGADKKHLASDPAVFPGDPGPHLHTFEHVRDSYWNASTVRLADTNNDDANIPRSSIVTALAQQTVEVFGFTGMQLGYWPTFVDGGINGDRTTSWYVGRPRNVAGIPGPTWEGNVIDCPQGLRMFTFKAGYFVSDGRWRFVARYPCWWNGKDLWLPGGAHLVHGDHPGSGQQGGTSHPYAIPMFHLFHDVNRSATLSRPLQSAQITDANPAAIYNGQRRDYWNYINVNVPTHAELMVLWDPIFSNFITWAINHRFGLGRIGQDR